MNQNQLHTPGPWRVGSNSGAVISDRSIEHGPNGCDCVDYYGGHLIAESIAPCNRNLIAAAPELLDALRVVVGQLEGHELNNGDVSAINNAYAAIAKATGANHE